MPRFFIEKGSIRDNIGTIVGEDVKHISRVLRLGVGDKVVLFDDAGWEYHARIKESSSRELRVYVFKKFLPRRESPIEIILGQGLPKPPKMDLIVQKGTELGISEILPFNSDRSVPKLTYDKSLKKVERWRKIALEATKQCGRNFPPFIAFPVDFSEILSKDLKDTFKLILWEEEEAIGLKAVLDLNPDANKFFVLVGPEGGFSSSEIRKAREAGFNVANMGIRILRSETASISILSVIQHRFGDLN
ncbi:MAG: 16S rRNA (uracil(1498)-N(3))-methyltransferase [Thermodesulfobacteriota bacterium]